MRHPSISTPGSSRRPDARTDRARILGIALWAVLLASCGSGRAAPPRDPAALQARASELTARLLIADAHIDYPDRASPYEDLTIGTSGNFDEPRARKGGLNLAFLAAYVPPEDEDAGTAFTRVEERISLVRGIAESGGVVCLAFGSYFLRDAFRTTHAAADLAAVRDVAEAIDRTVRIAGIDHVGPGSDFDGVGFSLPKELADVSMYANLVRELLSMGYGEEDLAKILGGNILRVWAEVRSRAEE